MKFTNILLALDFFTSYYKLERNIFFKDALTELRGTHDHLTRFCVNENLNTPKFRPSVCQDFFLYNAVIFGMLFLLLLGTVTQFIRSRLSCVDFITARRVINGRGSGRIVGGKPMSGFI